MIEKISALINYSPNTGNTNMIIFVGLGIAALILLIFFGMKRRK